MPHTMMLQSPGLPHLGRKQTPAASPSVSSGSQWIHPHPHRSHRSSAAACRAARTAELSGYYQQAGKSNSWATPPVSCRAGVPDRRQAVIVRSSALDAQSTQQQQQQQSSQQLDSQQQSTEQQAAQQQSSQQQQSAQQQTTQPQSSQQQTDRNTVGTAVPGLDLLYSSLDGNTIWRIRPYKESDFNALVQLQTDAFHQPPPAALRALHQMSYVNFRAEVLDGVKKKAKTIDGEDFQMYVAEDVTKAMYSIGGSETNGTGLSRQLPSWWQPAITHNSIGSTGSTEGSGTDMNSSNSSSSQQLAEGISTGVNGSDSSSGRRLMYMATPDSMVGELTGTLVGVVEIGQVDDDASVLQQLPRGTPYYGYISSMAVASAARRKGLAQALLHTVQTQSALWSQKHLALHVYDDNTPAVQLYLKYGFKQLGKDPSWRKLMGGRVRVLMYLTVPVPQSTMQQQTVSKSG